MTVVASSFERMPNELYQTEPWATHAILDHLALERHSSIWEPSAGNHKMADVFRDRGYVTITSDIVTYEREHTFIANFLGEIATPPPVDAIISNPPYGHQNIMAANYARRALLRCQGWVAMLLTAKFDFGSTRVDLFRDNERFHSKIALLDRIQWFEGNKTGTEDHAWYIWGPAAHAPYQPYMTWAHNRNKRVG